jgi:hypothetical protein
MHAPQKQQQGKCRALSGSADLAPSQPEAVETGLMLTQGCGGDHFPIEMRVGRSLPLPILI